MWVILIIILIAWVLSPIVLIPLLISMSSKIKKKDEEIRRLGERLAQAGKNAPIEETRLTIEDLRNAEPVGVVPLQEHAETASVHTEIQKQKTVKKPVRREVKPREKKKLETGHILFGIGVVLVFVAGLIFATSMWSVMPSIIKVTTLLGAAMFFVIVAWILEAKLKLREASVTMFVLGSAFMSLAVIAVGYFAWFGKAFSLGASSRYLVISVSIWVLCLTLMFGYKLYASNVFEIISYAASCAAFALLTRHIFNRGEISLLLTGIYMMGLLILIDRKGADILKKISRILSLGYVLISLLMYLAFGFNEVMSLVMLVCAAHMLFTAVSAQDGEKGNPYGWLYYAVPFVGAFFIYNTSNVYRFTIPHGDVAVGLILVLVLFFVYAFVPIKGERRLANLSSLICLLVCCSIWFGKLWYVTDRNHEGISDITEALPCLIIFALYAVIFSVEYIRKVRKLNKGETDFYTWAYIISLAVYVFMGLYAFVPVPGYAGIKHAEYLGTLIPACAISLVTLAVIILYHYRLAAGTITYGLKIARGTCGVMQNAALIISFLAFTGIEYDSYAVYALNLPLAVFIIIYQVHTRLRKSNPDGLPGALMLPFVLTSGLDAVMKKLFPDPAWVSDNAVFEAELLIFLFVLAAGLFMYRKLCVIDRDNKRILIDWNIFIAGIVLVIAIVNGESCDLDHVAFRSFAALAVLALYKAVRSEGVFRQIAFGFVTAFLCLAYVCQDFILWNADFEVELMSLALPAFAAILFFVIFRKKSVIASYISFGSVALFFLIEWLNITEIVSEPAIPVLDAKLTVFLLVAIAAAGYAWFAKSIRYDLMAVVLAVMLTASCIDNRRGGHLLAAAVLNIVLIVFCYLRKKRQPLTLVLLITLLAVITDTLDTRVMQFVSTGSFDISNGILVEAKPNYTPVCIIWILVFAIMLGLGRFLHKKLICRASDDHPFMIDWFTILAIFPVIVVWELGNEKFVWSVSLLIALYLFGYYRRVADFLNKPIMTAIAVCMAIAWWTQPVVRVGELFVTEFRIIGFLALVYVITKVIYKKELEGGLDFMYYASVASVIWQSVSAIRSAKLFDVIILGLVLLVIIVVAFEKKSRQWFLLSAISLVCIFLYMSRDFWRRIVWPVYVFAVGLILIFFATRNEYRKKHPVEDEDKKKFFEGWGK